MLFFPELSTYLANLCDTSPSFPSISSFPTSWRSLRKLTLTYLNSFTHNLRAIARQKHKVKIKLRNYYDRHGSRHKRERQGEQESLAMDQGNLGRSRKGSFHRDLCQGHPREPPKNPGVGSHLRDRQLDNPLPPTTFPVRIASSPDGLSPLRP